MNIYCHWISGEGRDGLEEALGGPEVGADSWQKLKILANHKNGPQ